MSSLDNLKPFSSENQPPGHKKSRKGIPNRATVFKKLLKLKAADILGDDATDAETDLTLIEAAALGQVLSARKGNTNAWKEIQDTLHGKLPDKVEHEGEVNVNHSGEIAFKQAAEKIYDLDGDNNKS